MNCSTWSVYKHTSPSDRVYIGITGRKPEVRWANGNGYIGNDYFFKAIQKYGWDNFKHEILFENLTKEEAESKEIDLIAQYNSTNRACGYNISSGGSATVAGLHWSRPKDGILRGEKHPMFGRHPTDEMRQRIADKLRGRSLTEETKRKMRSRVPWNKGRVMSDEEKIRISEALKGSVPVNRKAVVCVETGEIFESCEAAKRHKGISCLYKALKDQTKTAGGYHWQYYTERTKK